MRPLSWYDVALRLLVTRHGGRHFGLPEAHPRALVIERQLANLGACLRDAGMCGAACREGAAQIVRFLAEAAKQPKGPVLFRTASIAVEAVNDTSTWQPWFEAHRRRADAR